MATQVTNYQCPACTGPLHFGAASGKLECEYCGSSFTTDEIELHYKQKEESAKAAFQKDQTQWDTSGLSEDWGEDTPKLRAYNCPSCGAQLICDETTAATSCPYCGNPSIVPGQLDGILKPDYVIPFKLTKEDAVAALKKHYKGKVFLPKSFKTENHVQQIRGVYVPFWLFDGVADADVTFHATRSHTHRSGDREVTVTDHYRVRRAGTMAFEKVPVDASTKMPDNHMDSIEPFDYSQLECFSTAYLPGFLADKYDVSAEDCAPRADQRCKLSAVEALRSTVAGYHTCVTVDQNVSLERGAVKYALLPVWMLNTKWKGKEFLFAMNGQTGRLVGDLPVSWGKFWALFAGIALPLMAVMAAIV